MIQRYAAQDPMDEIRKAFVTRSTSQFAVNAGRNVTFGRLDTERSGKQKPWEKPVEMFDGDCKC
jgi:hypothetical protein